jgi:A/G-specific adenine glycosylase
VASIAYGQVVAPVDTNVRRVVSRVFAEPLAPARLQAQADALVDARDPATWTHASMELGATVCVARGPRCEACPVARWCASAGRVGAPRPRSRSAQPPFELTTRWLRGRIVQRLRALDDGEWERLPEAIGDHDLARIESAVEALQREGLLERRPDGAVRLPSG